MNRTTLLTGDFVLSGGPGTEQWLRSMGGFDIREGLPHGLFLATRGDLHAPQSSQPGDGWVALADLVGGDLTAAAQQPDAFVQKDWRGRFAFAGWNSAKPSLHAFTDHFGSLPLYWYRQGGNFAIASDLRLLLDAPGLQREPNLEAVYHYLNFAVIPAPLTICRGIHRIQPGTRLLLDSDQAILDRYYLPAYPADLEGDDATLAAQLRKRIAASVNDYRPGDENEWGCFLSGGTDSSSIVSILAQARERRQVQTCSIGFKEAGYDELDFARMAGESCGARTHLAQVDKDRALELLDTVLAAYDQPFGNASAIPTLACAELGAAQGLSILLGGDGGDEIFGGNERYAKDKVLEAFYRLPSPLKAAARTIGRAMGGGGNHLLNRVRNFTERGSLPNPDRFYTDDSFASDFRQELLTEQFRGQVAADASLQFMREIYALGSPAEPLHRIMRLDLLMAIAQNDLVKVHRACKHHQIAARFPYLDPSLVDFCGHLPARHKVKGLKKRYLFKQAMAGILPQAILRKRKQGFGLPIAVWMKEDPVFQARIREVLLGARTRERGWINPDFVARLVEMHMAGGWDHSAAIWQLLVLELWMRNYMDER